MGGVIGKAVTETRTAEQAYINASTPPSPSQQANEARRRNILNRELGTFGTM